MAPRAQHEIDQQRPPAPGPPAAGPRRDGRRPAGRRSWRADGDLTTQTEDNGRSESVVGAKRHQGHPETRRNAEPGPRCADALPPCAADVRGGVTEAVITTDIIKSVRQRGRGQHMGHDRDDRYEWRQKPSGEPPARTLASSSIRRTGGCSRGARRGLNASGHDRSSVLHRRREKTGPGAGPDDVDGFAGRGRKKSSRATDGKQKREEGSEKRTHERSLLIQPETETHAPRHSRRRRATNSRDLASRGPADLTPSRTGHPAVCRRRVPRTHSRDGSR